MQNSQAGAFAGPRFWAAESRDPGLFQQQQRGAVHRQEYGEVKKILG